ncbi:MAG: hypothetical protein FIA91_04280 [Geobacter sp.]|nr:hypothetical protein [Geobacter sp.]
MLPLGSHSLAEMRISRTVFDLKGDGRPEILINAVRNFKIFDGASGTLLFQEYAGWNWENSITQNVIVADVSGTGHAEAVVIGMNSNGSEQVLVYRAKNNDWVSTRRVWNQDMYHATNVNDDGSIPKYESPSWLLNNSYRCQVPTSTSSNPYLATDLTASFVRVDMANYPASVTITARIGNGGAKAAASGVVTSFYDGDPAAGGVLIGSAVTSKPLNPGEYEDITLVWNAPADGNHTVQVVANADNSQPECDKSNNSAALPVYVSSGKPDPSIVSSDIIAPASIPEGSLADILMTVRNIGTLQADNVMVRLYNGNPAQGGKQIGGDRVVATIAAGGAATLTTTWNTLGAKGTNYIYVVVDPNASTGDVNRGNNIAMKELIVTAAEKPDLWISSDDITITPATPGEGDLLNISALVHNLGTQTANVKVALYDGNPVFGGIKRGEAQIPWIIPAGGSATATFTLDTIGLAGSRTFYVKADPDNSIDESNKVNNQASRNITILPSGVTLNLSTDKAEYSANEAVRLTVTVGNSRTSERNLSYNIQLLDKTGAYAATVAADTALHMPANAASASTLEWNTGTTYSGAYTAALQISENGRMIAKVTTPINILPVKKADVRIVSDKATYGVNEQIAITATVAGTSPNYILSDLTSRTTVIDTAGQTLFTETDVITSLALGQHIERKHYWNSGTKPKGIYTLKLELIEGGVAIATAQSGFSINGTAESGAGLTGAVSLQPASVEAGNPVTVLFSIANRGNEDIANLLLTLLIADPESGQVLKTITGIADGALAINATQTGDIPLSTTGLTPKTLLAILQSTLQGVTKSLANASFTVIDTIPPVLTVSTLSDGSYTNQEALNVSGSVNDNSGAAQVEINGTVVPVAADGSFSQMLLLAKPDNAVEVKAIDLAGNKTVDSRTIHFDKSAPILTIDAPADNSKTALSPIEVKGSVDETSTVTVKLNGVIQPVIMNNNLFSASIVPEPRWNTIEVTAVDLAGNTSSQKRSVLFDDQKPSLSITEPDQDVRTNKSSITISGKASDPYSAVGVTVAIDGAILTPQVIGDSFSQVVTFTDEKLYPVVVTASNEVGTQTTVQRNIIFDKTPPNLTIDPVVTPTNVASQTVSGTRDAGALLTVTCATATVGAVEYPTDTTWKVAVSGLTLGENRLQVETTDLAGNRTIASATILYVPKAPEVTISASPNQLWPPNKKLIPVRISGNVSTFGSDVKEVTVSVADEYGKYNIQGLRFGDTIMLEASRDGNDMDGRVYTITAVVTDMAGNKTTKSTTVIVPHDMGK